MIQVQQTADKSGHKRRKIIEQLKPGTSNQLQLQTRIDLRGFFFCGNLGQGCWTIYFSCLNSKLVIHEKRWLNALQRPALNGLASVFDSKIFQPSAINLSSIVSHSLNFTGQGSVSWSQRSVLHFRSSSFHFSLSWGDLSNELWTKNVWKLNFTELEYILNARIYVDQRFAGKILGNRVWPQDSTEQSGNENVVCK